jgi:hypothetical protein
MAATFTSAVLLGHEDNIAVMSYPAYNNFMNRHRLRNGNGLKPFRKGLQAYVSRSKQLN